MNKLVSRNQQGRWQGNCGITLNPNIQFVEIIFGQKHRVISVGHDVFI
jgi:hypothetical protein